MIDISVRSTSTIAKAKGSSSSQSEPNIMGLQPGMTGENFLGASEPVNPLLKG